MPCTTIQISGPEVQGNTRVTDLSASQGSQPNSASLNYTVENTYPEQRTVNVTISADGQAVDTRETIVSGNSTMSESLEVRNITNIPAGQSADVTICAEAR